jgi:hypothetical protein
MINIKKLAAILFGLLSFEIYGNSEFNIISQCSDEYETSCDVIRKVGGKEEVILNKIKSPSIERITENLFHVISSCGSPCVGHFFISRKEQDFTSELIILDASTNCMVESDSSKKKIYAKKIFSEDRRILLNLKDSAYESLPSKFNYYSNFNEMSNFDKQGNLNLVADDYGEILIRKTIKNPCEAIKK